jgi:hypothetical protein
LIASIGQFFLVIAIFHGLVFGGDGDFSLGDRQRCRNHFDVVVVSDNFPIAVCDFGFAGDGILAYNEIVEIGRTILESILHRQRIASIQLKAVRQFISKGIIGNCIAISKRLFLNIDSNRLFLDSDCVGLGGVSGVVGGGDGHDQGVCSGSCRLILARFFIAIFPCQSRLSTTFCVGCDFEVFTISESEFFSVGQRLLILIFDSNRNFQIRVFCSITIDAHPILISRMDICTVWIIVVAGAVNVYFLPISIIPIF